MRVRLVAAPAQCGPTAFAGRQSAAVGKAACACRSLLIPRNEPTAACKFLFFLRRGPSTKPLHRSVAALQHSLVNINENRSERCLRGPGREFPTRWGHCRNWRAGCRCSAARARNIKPEGAIETRHGWAAAIADPCRPLLIPRSRGPAKPAKACRSLLIHGIRPAEPVRSGGSPARRHGHSRTCRPPSRLTESGGRL
jgi:hypothetical protein